jgi:hypothetical protein
MQSTEQSPAVWRIGITLKSGASRPNVKEYMTHDDAMREKNELTLLVNLATDNPLISFGEVSFRASEVMAIEVSGT